MGRTHAPDELAALRKKHLEKEPCARVARRGSTRPPSLSQSKRVNGGGRKADGRQGWSNRVRIWRCRRSQGGRFLGPALAYNPTNCLDDILMGYGVDMQYLEALFGLERHRIPEQAAQGSEMGENHLFGSGSGQDHGRAAKEKLPERKPGARGGSEKKLWLSTPEVRNRVLMGIGWRALAVSRYRETLDPFMIVVSRHLPSGDSEERLPKDAEDTLRAHVRSLPFLGSLSATCPDSGK